LRAQIRANAAVDETSGIFLCRVTGLSWDARRSERGGRCLVLLLALVRLWLLFLAVAPHLTFRHVSLPLPLLLECDDLQQRDARQFDVQQFDARL
jgi:hypothetical protein